MTTASVTLNRITLGVPPPHYAELYQEGRRLGLRVPEVLRHIIATWVADRSAPGGGKQ
jgi:hypothetical protein